MKSISAPIDIEQPAELLEYLRTSGRIGSREEVRMTPLQGGVSNRAVLVERPSGEAWVVKQALPKLRVVSPWYSDPGRAEREALGTVWLSRVAPPGTIPRLCFSDPAQHLLVLQAIPKPHECWKALLLRGEVRRDHVEQFARLLAAIHVSGWRERARTAVEFDDRSYFESLRLEPYYEYSRERVPQASRFLTNLIEETRARRLTVVHGDYSPKNVLVFQNKLVLLDHEVIHFGDPAFDVGFALAHLFSKAHHLRQWRDAFAEAAVTFWSTYVQEAAAECGIAPEPAAVRHALGCLLARVVGRSPLEYLSDDERERQKCAVLMLIEDQPTSVAHLTRQFLARV